MRKTRRAKKVRKPAASARRLVLFLGALAALASCAAPPTVPPPAPPPVRVPPPADVGDCRSCHAGSGDYPLAADVYRFWESSGHGQFLDRSGSGPHCLACHDLAGASASGHLDGQASAPSPNTFHLVGGYIHPDPKKEWDIQVHFDDYCWTACHQEAEVRDMRHGQDTDPVLGAVQMGQHLSFDEIQGDLPGDEDIARTRRDFTGQPQFAPCISCHDPHGSDTESTTKGSNRMVRENFKKPVRLCGHCHA